MKINQRSIFGIGLPRTGTYSLSLALEMINIETQHYCLLSSNKKCKKTINGNASVDNSYYRNYKKLFKQNENSKFILTTRESKTWNESLILHNKDNIKLPDVNVYANEVIDFFKNANAIDRLLIINVFYEDNVEIMKKICKFLSIDYNEKLVFPNNKKM